MNIDKYTTSVQSALMDCQNIAIEMGHQMVDVEHLHMALLSARDGLIPKILRNIGVDVDSLKRDLNEELDKLPKVSGGGDNIYSGRRITKVLMAAEKIAGSFKDEYVSVEHVYHAIIDEKSGPGSKLISK